MDVNGTREGGATFSADWENWYSPPGHIGALSKLLVGPDRGGSDIDFRMSIYPPGAYTERHVHARAEHVYYVVSGVGKIIVGDVTTLVSPRFVSHIPAGLEHEILCTGPDDLELVVVSVPADDMPR